MYFRKKNKYIYFCQVGLCRRCYRTASCPRSRKRRHRRAETKVQGTLSKVIVVWECPHRRGVRFWCKGFPWVTAFVYICWWFALISVCSYFLFSPAVKSVLEKRMGIFLWSRHLFYVMPQCAWKPKNNFPGLALSTQRSDSLAWQQVSLPAEPSHQFRMRYFIVIN